MRRQAIGLLGAALLCVVSALPAAAIETDQYYAWGRPLKDSTKILNAKSNYEIGIVLEEVNRGAWERTSCEKVARRVIGRFRKFIFHDLELWAGNSPLVDRIPATAEEELRFRDEYLYHATHALDVGIWIPPSPTIEVNGVRIGTDKLAHFFSEGWYYHRSYVKARRKGLDHEQAVTRAIERGMFVERTFLGMAASGVLSPADLEANYQGMLFFNSLCDPERPALARTDDGWQMARPLDFRDHVTPEWDESYQTSVFSGRRWKKVRPVLVRYCPLLDDPTVAARRRSYADRDQETLTEALLRRRIEEGKLNDPSQYSIEFVCSPRGRELASLATTPDDTRP